jgi:transcriptional regulator with XRE-family HTH domain
MRIKLINKRKEVGIKQVDLAKKLKCTTRQVRRWELGQVNVPFDKAKKWASLLGVSMNKFATLYINKEETK